MHMRVYKFNHEQERWEEAEDYEQYEQDRWEEAQEEGMGPLRATPERPLFSRTPSPTHDGAQLLAEHWAGWE